MTSTAISSMIYMPWLQFKMNKGLWSYAASSVFNEAVLVEPTLVHATFSHCQRQHPIARTLHEYWAPYL